MNPVPLDTYIRCVLGIKAHARKLIATEEAFCRGEGQSISDDIDVLIRNLKDNGHIEDFDLPDL